ncbi:MAG: Methyltransferase type 11 [Verrucomicrobiales bacterium]|nr:Methyltransferase type 11 [Verrucomicrobiales bacterium]
MFENAIKVNEFNPSRSGIFFNASYIIRRTISEALRTNAAFLKGKVLDYGCGSRPYEHFFTEATQYIGGDIESGGHPADRKKADIYFEEMKVPLPDRELDGVLASEVLEHLFDLPGCLHEFHRLLKPGGRVLVTCPFVWPLHEQPYDFARYTSYALKSEFEKAGFRLVKQERLGTPIEVLGQMYLADLLPEFSIVRKIPVLRTFVPMLVLGGISGFCRLGARFSDLKRERKLYLTNLVLAEKI